MQLWSATANFGSTRRARAGVDLSHEPSHTKEEAGVELQKRRWVPPSATKKIEVLSRSAFRERLRGVDPKRLIFVDESSNIATNIALSPRAMPAGRPEEREGLREGAQENWGKNITLISSIRLSGMGASMSIQGSSDTEYFPST